MSSTAIVFRREFRSYFDSPIAYIFVIVFLLLTCGLYMASFFLSGMADMRQFFSTLPLFNLFFLPAVSMRLWAEEKRTGTMELLMTLPLRSRDVVLGKYLSSLAFYTIALAATFPIPVTLSMLGNPDMGAIATGYIGSFLLGSFYLSIGIFVSGLFKDQITAFVVSLMLCLFFFFAGNQLVVVTTDGWFPGLGSFLQSYVGFELHFADIQRGVLDMKNLLYFVSMSALFLVLNALSLEGRRF